ncbi:MAG TPA: amidase [Candidatus Sulfotelmatobacter sp.]|nr:amidase [Candidatus Sulfotelmatobacter sp.]
MNVSNYSTIAEVAAAVRSRQVSPVELVDATLARIEKLEPKLTAFMHLDAAGARKQARAAEEAVTRGASVSSGLGPLHGVPLTIKCNIDVAGLACPAGSPLRADYVPTEDAPLVARLRAAGAIILGNTNTPEFLMAWESNNPIRGGTSNPWNLAHSAGGSSGGEAAAISSGCSFGGIGSDGGGSIRVPAHFCGICGLKPTPGRVPSTGHYPPGAGALSWLGVVGPMARTIADVRALFEVVAGPDAGDALSAPVPIADAARVAERLKGIRIGVLETDALGKATPETEAAVQRAAKILEGAGFPVEPFRIDRLDRVIDCWWFFFGPVVAQLFMETVKGHEATLSPIFEEYYSTALPQKPLSGDAILSARTDRDDLRAAVLRQMRDVSILLSPVSSEPAFRHGEGNYQLGKPHCYRDTMRFSQWTNLTGLPGATVPLGMSAEGLPIGVQVIGRPHEEELVLAVAEKIETARGAWVAPPIG